MKSEDGELNFPVRSSVGQIEVNSGRVGSLRDLQLRECETEEEVPPLLDVKDMELSPALKSKMQSLMGSILICESKTCPTCGPRMEKMAILETQIKAEMVSVYGLKRNLNSAHHDLLTLKAYIDTNEGPETAMGILRTSKMRKI